MSSPGKWNFWNKKASQLLRAIVTFFELPGEIRNTIYKHCLVVGNVYPNLESHCWEVQTDVVHQDAYYFEAPNVSLLKTCKRVIWEAEHLLSQKNTFVMPTASLTARFFANTMTTAVRRSWLKSVEIYLDPSDLDSEDRKVIFGPRLDWYRQFERALQ